MQVTEEKLRDLIEDFNGWVSCPCSECNYAKSHGIDLRASAHKLAEYLAEELKNDTIKT
jgi:hypothetical protein